MFLFDHQRQCLEQLAKDKGQLVACHVCGQESVGVHEDDTGGWYRPGFRVALSCHNPACVAGAGEFYITAEEARDCGIPPQENPPISETI